MSQILNVFQIYVKTLEIGRHDFNNNIMQKYINQLLKDLEQKIIDRWNTQPPHYFENGLPDPYVEPPEGWNKEKHDYLKEERAEILPEIQLGEMEKWLDGVKEGSMFYKFGLMPEQFPPVRRLTEEQMSAIVLKLLRLWGAYNFTAVLPDNLPNNWIYKTLLKRMLEPSLFANFGHIGIEFCYYEPSNCPFPLEYCSCKDFG
jgi:hypothetical protein